MTHEHENRIYHDVLHDVLWGSERHDVFHRLEVNGITGEQAETLFAKARKERIALIRSEAMRKVIKGMVLLLAGLGIFLLFWDGAGAITRGVFVTCFVAWAFGGYWLIDGVVAAIFAPTKKGSVADEGN